MRSGSVHKPARHLATIALVLISASSQCIAEVPFRDPTRPYTAAERRMASSPRFVVNAIIVSDDRRVAIVNGRRVGVGSSVGGATVIAIEKSQLILEIGGKQITARLNEGATRR